MNFLTHWAMQTNPRIKICWMKSWVIYYYKFLAFQNCWRKQFFSIAGVVTNLQDKLIKRHPHVFGDVELESAEDVEKQWEDIKKQETSDSIFDDIDQKLPSITKAFKTQRKAKKLELTYKNYEDALQDLLSEVEELKIAKNDEDRKSEIGDILFSVINICRYLEADPEIQLNRSTKKFIWTCKICRKECWLKYWCRNTLEGS